MFLFKDKESWKNPTYTYREEIAASISHGVGAGFAAVGMILLVVLAVLYGDAWQVIAFSIYGASLFFLYSASTLYHGVQSPHLKRSFRLMDHVGIYLLIAGTYTPFLLVSMRDTLGWTLLLVIWGMAFAGILWKIFFLGRFEILATMFYVLMGCLAIVGIRNMLVSIPPTGVGLLASGGAVYILGVIFYAWEKIPYNHAIWHFFVLGGSALHFFAVFTLVGMT